MSNQLTEMKWPDFVAWMKQQNVTFDEVNKHLTIDFRGSRTTHRVFSPSLPKDFKGRAAKVRGWADLVDVPPETKVHVLYDDAISARWVRLGSIVVQVWEVERLNERRKAGKGGAR